MSSISEFLILHATPQATETFEQCASSGKTGCLMGDPLPLYVFAVMGVAVVLLTLYRREVSDE